jgi:hypothetical protein
MFDERGSSPEVLKMPREEHSIPPVRDLKEPPSVVVHPNSLMREPAGSRCCSRSLESVLLRDGIGEPECSIRWLKIYLLDLGHLTSKQHSKI